MTSAVSESAHNKWLGLQQTATATVCCCRRLLLQRVAVLMFHNVRVLYCLWELYVADFPMSGMYESERAWAHVWDVFRRTPSTGDRRRRASGDFIVCFGCGGISFFSWYIFSSNERARPAASTRPPCLIYLSASNEAVFCFSGKNASSYRGAYRVQSLNWFVCLSDCVCVTFVVFTDCESCTRPISTIPGSMEGGEYGITRGACFVARRLEVVAVDGML